MALTYPIHLCSTDVLTLDVNGRQYRYTATNNTTVKNESEARRLTGAPCYPLTVKAGDYVDLPEIKFDGNVENDRVREKRTGFIIAQDYTFEDMTKVVGFYLLAEGFPEIGMFLPK